MSFGILHPCLQDRISTDFFLHYYVLKHVLINANEVFIDNQSKPELHVQPCKATYKAPYVAVYKQTK